MCWFPLAYFALGPRSVGGAAGFAILIGGACAFGTMRGVRAYQADQSRAGRLREARRGGVRLGVMFGLLAVFGAIAVGVDSFAVLVLGVIAAIVAPMLLRLLGR